MHASKAGWPIDSADGKFRVRNAWHRISNQRVDDANKLYEVSMDYDRIVAVGLNTRNDARLLGPSLDSVWPVDETPCFSGLLRAIDQADRQHTGSPPLTMH